MTKIATLDVPGMELTMGMDLHPHQREVLNDPARFKLLRAGRRWRKSGLGVVQAFTGYDGPDGRRFRGALEGGNIGWWVPSMTARYIISDWLPIRGIAAQIPGAGIEEANHRVVMPNDGGWIMMLTGDNIDSGRGLGLDGAVLDEASLLQEQLWTETIRPTLLDRIGWAFFLFTPRGLNWIYDLELDNKERPDWRAWHFRSEDNPYVEPSELAEFRQQQSILTQRQEIDAEYVSSGAGVFHSEWIQHYWTQFEGDGEEPAKPYIVGDEAVSDERCRKFHTVDLAWSLEENADYTVISSWAQTPKKHLLLLDMVRGHFEGPDIVPKLRLAFKKFGGVLVVEKATRQMNIIQEAVRQGLPVRVVKADKDKESRALPAAARMEQGRVWFPPPSTPWFRDIEQELLAFPAGKHDDFVDTLAYAVQEVAGSTPYDDRGLRFV